jgi:hypothetical protein
LIELEIYGELDISSSFIAKFKNLQEFAFVVDYDYEDCLLRYYHPDYYNAYYKDNCNLQILGFIESLEFCPNIKFNFDNVKILSQFFDNYQQLEDIKLLNYFEYVKEILPKNFIL